ncbi:PVC-type heme-binding CxxCH protein [Rubripirellula amarantea]|nr:PVC-type heme-binding CxxCH protein [Rubripirellula amarantea]
MQRTQNRLTVNRIVLCCLLAVVSSSWVAAEAAESTTGTAATGSAAADHAIVQAMLRIPGAKLDHYPQRKEAVLRHVQRLSESDPASYLRIAGQLGVPTDATALTRIIKDPNAGQASIEAAKMLAQSGGMEPIADLISNNEGEARISLIETIGHVGNKEVAEVLMPYMMDQSQPTSVRSAAASAIGKHWHGQQLLLGLARENKVPEGVKFEVSNALLGSWTPEVVDAAKKIESLKPAVTSADQVIPSIRELSQINGDPDSGKAVFNKEGTCIKCHKVAGEGKEVGPDLSEIGSKLSKEDMFVSILNPSAGISHNYETYACLTVDGKLITGLLVGETEEEITIKTADAVLTKIPADDVEDLRKQEVSLMPADLQKAMSVQQLVDLVDYLRLLKKPEEAAFNAVVSAGGPPSREANDAIAGFEIAEGLKVQLAAAEPMMLSPTSIDVDHLGRVWVCEVVNYRHFRNPNNEVRESGDRILVMEDTDQDGAMDKTTVFYQGTDVDSPHGICVLGDRVILSAGENVMVFRDTNGDLKADEKTLMFTGISGEQHDHGIHSFMPGPDGKLYFNFGNEGKQLKDAFGKPIVDKAGNVVNDTRQPYQHGMVFRCDLDGSNVETLGWNFRNNWEVAVDSFGAMWQSDNDDDGNRGTRINFVMEFGNYGYRNEKSGNYWQAERIGMREDIGERHWHLNDPGVVPNLLQTGAGSPTGIIVYEGNLLPEKYQNQIIHTDPGPNVVRAYPVQDSGAGYTATIENMVRGVQDPWFRPVDVCTAPDGSVIVADWYDPGVGGHRMGDTKQGRLFRITVPGHESYVTSKPDFTSLEGASKALASPNNETRFLAGQAIKTMWSKNAPNIDDYLDADKVTDARLRARWMWLLAKTASTEKAAIMKALTDSETNIRLAAIRAARQSAQVDDLAVAEMMMDDSSPQVHRELAVLLRGHNSEKAVELWTALALKYDGKDRWYLEALGLSAEGKWDACLDHWLEAVGDDWNSPARRDIVWRARSNKAAELMGQLILQSETSKDQERYFRALEFFDDDVRKNAMSQILAGA